LASCGIDQDSTIVIWDWRKGKILTKSAGHQERIFELQFRPGTDNQLVSCGVKQISFWKLIGNTMQKKKGIFGNPKNITTMFCLAFSDADKDLVYTGTILGQIYIWKGQELKEIIPSVHSSSIFQITPLNGGYATAGKDSCIRTWDASFAPLESINLKQTMSHMNSPDFFFPHELVIRSIVAKNSRLLIGTQSSEIFEVDLANDDLGAKCLCKGHGEGELWSLAVSPVDPDVCATASDDKTVRVWNLKEKRLLKITELEKKVRSCSFSGDGKHLACGLTDGLLVVLNVEDMAQVYSKKSRTEVLHEMKYSPCGKFLAVGSNDNYVDILTVPSYKRISVCSGNSSFITHVDWSKDSQYVQTNSGDGQRLIYKADSKFE
jgi:WD40 repeat protein